MNTETRQNITYATAKAHGLQDGEIFDFTDSRPAFKAAPVEVVAEALTHGRFALISTATGERVAVSRPATKIGITDGSRD